MEQQPNNCTGPHQTGRRNFLQWLSFFLSGVAGAVMGLPVVGYFLGTRKRTVNWVSLDDVASFPLNQTLRRTFDNPLRQPWDGVTSLTGVFVRNLGTDEKGQPTFDVFAANCAHLGCPVSWFPQSGLFLCPCHGGVYHANGDRASGPPTRGLFRCAWRVENGKLEVQAPHYPSMQDTLTKEDA